MARACMMRFLAEARAVLKMGGNLMSCSTRAMVSLEAGPMVGAGMLQGGLLVVCE